MRDALISTAQAVWRQQQRWREGELPQPLRDWLFDVGSLTQRVQQYCAGAFAVELLGQGRERPLQEEALALGLSRGQWGLVRKVHLSCAGRPWVFARTVIPPRTLAGRRRRLAYLGTRPLGAMLFSQRSMRRGAMEAARLTAGHPLYEAAVRSLESRPPWLWGRRSLFFLDGQPLLVCEIFLPPSPAQE